MKQIFIRLLVWMFVIIGTYLNIDIGRLEIHYFLQTNDKWDLIDIGITILNLIGLITVLIVLRRKKMSINQSKFLYKILTISGLVGLCITLIMLGVLFFYFHITIPRLPPKISIVGLSASGIFIRLIYEQRIKEGKATGRR